MIVLGMVRTGGHGLWWDLVRKYPEIREGAYTRDATIENLTLVSTVGHAVPTLWPVDTVSQNDQIPRAARPPIHVQSLLATTQRPSHLL